MIPPRQSHWIAWLPPPLKIYSNASHGFLFQHHDQFAKDVLEFLMVCTVNAITYEALCTRYGEGHPAKSKVA